jgi:hypothetical protein
MQKIHRHGGMMTVHSNQEHDDRNLPTAVQQLMDVVAAINAMPEEKLAAHGKAVSALNQQMAKLTETLEAQRRMDDAWLTRIMAW